MLPGMQQLTYNEISPCMKCGRVLAMHNIDSDTICDGFVVQVVLGEPAPRLMTEEEVSHLIALAREVLRRRPPEEPIDQWAARLAQQICGG